jgi:hypothetical protein
MIDANEEMMTLIMALVEDNASMYPSNQDRYAEFRQLFTSTDAGTRVFKELMIIGRLSKISASRGDPHQTYLYEGMRNMALSIAKVTFEEPVIPPTRQVSTVPQEG